MSGRANTPTEISGSWPRSTGRNERARSRCATASLDEVRKNVNHKTAMMATPSPHSFARPNATSSSLGCGCWGSVRRQLACADRKDGANIPGATGDSTSQTRARWRAGPVKAGRKSRDACVPMFATARCRIQVVAAAGALRCTRGGDRRDRGRTPTPLASRRRQSAGPSVDCRNQVA